MLRRAGAVSVTNNDAEHDKREEDEATGYN